jgi:hypothetical protein
MVGLVTTQPSSWIILTITHHKTKHKGTFQPRVRTISSWPINLYYELSWTSEFLLCAQIKDEQRPSHFHFGHKEACGHITERGRHALTGLPQCHVTRSVDHDRQEEQSGLQLQMNEAIRGGTVDVLLAGQ